MVNVYDIIHHGKYVILGLSRAVFDDREEWRSAFTERVP